MGITSPPPVRVIASHAALHRGETGAVPTLLPRSGGFNDMREIIKQAIIDSLEDQASLSSMWVSDNGNLVGVEGEFDIEKVVTAVVLAIAVYSESTAA